MKNETELKSEQANQLEGCDSGLGEMVVAWDRVVGVQIVRGSFV